MTTHCDQCARLLRALKKRPLTKRYIINVLGILNAGGRVYDLRGQGYDIRTEMITVRKTGGGKTKVAKYVYKGRMRNSMKRAA